MTAAKSAQEHTYMRNNPYTQFDPAELILRDQLAIDRTLLANERTLMSYLRSGVALFIAGVSIIHFSHEVWFTVTGFLCLPFGFFTVLFGIYRYKRMDKAITAARQGFNNTMENKEQDEG
jgi:putative membrane protein